MTCFYDDLFEYVSTLEIIDTHEHLPYCEDARIKNTDILAEYLTHYFNRDLISAGLPQKDYQRVIDTGLPLMERWDLAEPYWAFARHTGYGRALDLSVEKLYGIKKICRSTIEELNQQFTDTLKQPGHFKKVLKDASRIKISVLDSNLACDRYFFRSVYLIDKLISPKYMADIEHIENEADVKISSFDDWLEACEIIINKAVQLNAVALKCGLAYERSLKFDRVSKSDAEDGFNEMFKAFHLPFWTLNPIAVSVKFQDYMMHFIMRIANKQNLVVQIHTGLQEGNGNIIYYSDPSLLTNLFLEYKDVSFDIFHIGYPYQQVLSALAKVFPNVYIDMCWAHIISPAASVNALAEWIDAVPANKISAFGGDYSFIDAVYGHQLLARINVSRALAKKIEDGCFCLDEAKHMAKMLFYDNPVRILRLSDI